MGFEFDISGYENGICKKTTMFLSLTTSISACVQDM